MLSSIETTTNILVEHDYYPDVGLATSLFLAVRMGRPLFLEGAPGVGKTELAKVVARAFSTEFIRLQCYEGLSLAQAVYEWNYPRQLLKLQTKWPGSEANLLEDSVYTREFLLERPVLQALLRSEERPAVLLIDEIDRADEEFESFLLELLSEFQVSIPELGVMRARYPPLIFLTSNRTREIHDALKRRCIYHWIDYPSFEREITIVANRVPGADDTISRQIVTYVQLLREVELYKPPGVSETIDWVQALAQLGVDRLERSILEATSGVVLKYEDDIRRFKNDLLDELLRKADIR